MQHTVAIFILILIILFRIYRRIRKVGAFQKFVKWRMITRMGLMTIAGITLLILDSSRPVIYLVDASGILLGSIISYFAIRTSAFEWRKDEWFYSQNPWISIFLLVLFIGRIICRAYQMYVSAGAMQMLGSRPVLLAISYRDPSTTVILFILITYYVVYYTFLIRTERQIKTNREENVSI
jgi:membrane protein CcdC involved in cytochrome C biogenesis